MVLGISEFLQALYNNFGSGAIAVIAALGSTGIFTLIGNIIALVKNAKATGVTIENVEKAMLNTKEEIKDTCVKEIDAKCEDLKVAAQTNSIVAKMVLILAAKSGCDAETISQLSDLYNQVVNADVEVSKQIATEAKAQEEKEQENAQSVVEQLEALKVTQGE